MVEQLALETAQALVVLVQALGMALEMVDGSGDGTGDGDGSGVGIGSSGMLNPQRTTDDLFFKELFQMNTQARDTQQIVRAGQPLQTFQQRQRQLQPVDRPRLGMLTDPELLKRYKY